MCRPPAADAVTGPTAGPAPTPARCLHRSRAATGAVNRPRPRRRGATCAATCGACATRYGGVRAARRSERDRIRESFRD